MTLVRNAKTKVYEADVRSRTMPRLHVSLRTTKKAEAMTRHEAVVKLVREGHTDLVDLLRRRKLTVEQVEACVRERRDFATLRAKAAELAWPTVDAAAEEYITWLETHADRAENTARLAGKQLKVIRAFVYEADGEAPRAVGSYRVDELPTRAVDALMSWLRQTYAENTSTHIIMRLQGLYTWLRKRETRDAREAKPQRHARLLHTPIDPETRGKRKREGRKRFLSVAEAQRVEAATPPYLRLPVFLGLFCGLRIHEVVYLRHADVDLELGLVRVQERAGWQPKYGKNRDVPMVPEVRAAFAEHLARGYAGETYLVPAGRGGRIDDAVLRRRVDRVTKDAGLTVGRADPLGVTFHTLRHTFASHLIMRGVDLYTVAQLLGDRLETVEEVYSHLSPDHKRQAIAKLAGFLTGTAPAEASPAGPEITFVTPSDTGGPTDAPTS